MKPTDMDRKMLYQESFQKIEHGGLHVGDIDALHENSTAKFDLVVSVCQDTAGDNVGCDYVHYPLADDEQSQDRWGGTTDYRVFSAACETTRMAREADEYENVLVHCHSGQNRSVAVCAAVIGAMRDCTYDMALAMISDARPIANPNDLMESHAKRYIRES